MFYELAPEVAGHFGPDTVMDASTRPPIIHALHYEFDGWLGDDLVQTLRCFIVTDDMKQLIESAQPSGGSFADVKVSASEQFQELYPTRTLPHFSWLVIHGIAWQDDLGISSKGSLVVSERLLQVMRLGRLDHCEISAA